MHKCWLKEYLRAQDERKQQVAKPGDTKLSDGRVVLSKELVKVKGKWRLGRVKGSIVGKDGVPRGYKIRTGNGYVVEHPLQLIQDLEIGAKLRESEDGKSLNTEAEEFVPKRLAKEDARVKIASIQLNKDERY